MVWISKNIKVIFCGLNLIDSNDMTDFEESTCHLILEATKRKIEDFPKTTFCETILYNVLFCKILPEC